MNENEAEFYLEKLFQYFKVSNMSELARKIGVTQKAVSNWKTRNSVSAIKKKCRELGIYQEIFRDINNFQNSTNVVGQDFSNNSNASHSQQIFNNKNYDIDENVLKLVDSLYGFAKKSNKIDKLIEDLSALIPKYT